jgi:putative DNA primase/helicase
MKSKRNSRSKQAAILERLSDVTSAEVDYVWPGRIPRGKLTIIVGEPGVGKSFLTLDIAARVSSGRKWPDASVADRGRVIHLSAEDGLADTIKPRIDAMKGNSRGVFSLRGIATATGDQFFSLSRHLRSLREAIRLKHAAVVIIDPLSAFLGTNVDSYKDADVRNVLGPVSQLAEDERVAIIAVMHLTKDVTRAVIHRALGSVAFVAAPRAVFLLAKHPGDDAVRVLAPMKFNLGVPPCSLAFRIKRDRVKWTKEPVTLGADQIVKGGADLENRSAIEEATHFLQQALVDKPMLAAEVIQSAKSNGIAEATLRRAKNALGITSRHSGYGGSGSWAWELPKKKS